MTVALVTAADLDRPDEDHPLLARALDEEGVPWRVCSWSDPSVDWAGFGLVVIRSTWDYPLDRDGFSAWADRVASVTELANAAPVVRWNTDKRYLRELEQAGVPVVPTTWLEPGTPVDLPAGDVVVKPVVSAGARDTGRFGPGQRDAAVAHATRLLGEGRDVMVQPYVRSVDVEGERGLVFVEGAFGHAFTKGALLPAGAAPSRALFVEEEIGPAAPADDERALAEATLAALPWPREDLLYARVDMARLDDGSPALMELELVEPSLWYVGGPGTATLLARAIVRRVG